MTYAKATTHFLQGQDLQLVEAFTSELKQTRHTHKCSSKKLEAYYIAFHECLEFIIKKLKSTNGLSARYIFIKYNKESYDQPRQHIKK